MRWWGLQAWGERNLCAIKAHVGISRASKAPEDMRLKGAPCFVSGLACRLRPLGALDLWAHSTLRTAWPIDLSRDAHSMASAQHGLDLSCAQHGLLIRAEIGRWIPSGTDQGQEKVQGQGGDMPHVTCALPGHGVCGVCSLHLTAGLAIAELLCNHQAQCFHLTKKMPFQERQRVERPRCVNAARS